MDRWNNLFEQLEAEQQHDFEAQQRDTADQVTRAEIQQIRLVDRLRAHVGETVTVITRKGEALEGRVRRAETEWLLLSIYAHRVIVPIRAVAVVRNLTEKVLIAQESEGAAGSDQTPAHKLAAKNLSNFSLLRVLRDISRDREFVTVNSGAVESTGLISKVAADHIDVIDLARSQEWGSGGSPRANAQNQAPGLQFARAESRTTTHVIDCLDFIRLA